MTDRVCRICNVCKPLAAFQKETKRATFMLACRECRAAQRRTARREYSGRREDIDPHMAVMVGAALVMWKGPADRSRALVPAIGCAA